MLATEVSGAKTRATFLLPRDMLEDVRDAVVALSGPPDRLTMARFAENAFRSELERLRQARGGRLRGRSFPPREEEVRTGRPIA